MNFIDASLEPKTLRAQKDHETFFQNEANIIVADFLKFRADGLEKLRFFQ